MESCISLRKPQSEGPPSSRGAPPVVRGTKPGAPAGFGSKGEGNGRADFQLFLKPAVCARTRTDLPAPGHGQQRRAERGHRAAGRGAYPARGCLAAAGTRLGAAAPGDAGLDTERGRKSRPAAGGPAAAGPSAALTRRRVSTWPAREPAGTGRDWTGWDGGGTAVLTQPGLCRAQPRALPPPPAVPASPLAPRGLTLRARPAGAAPAPARPGRTAGPARPLPLQCPGPAGKPLPWRRRGTRGRHVPAESRAERPVLQPPADGGGGLCCRPGAAQPLPGLGLGGRSCWLRLPPEGRSPGH